MQIYKIDDPRNPLSKIRRKPLERFFKSHFPDRWKAGMPANVMRIMLEAEGIHDIPDAKPHVLGASPQAPLPKPNMENAKDADLVMMDEWKSGKFDTRYDETMDIGFLRREAKAKGIKMARTDKRSDIVRKLNGQNAA